LIRDQAWINVGAYDSYIIVVTGQEFTALQT